MNTDPVEADLEYFLEGEELAQHHRVMERLANLAAQKTRKKAQRRFRALHRKLDRDRDKDT